MDVGKRFCIVLLVAIFVLAAGLAGAQETLNKAERRNDLYDPKNHLTNPFQSFGISCPQFHKDSIKKGVKIYPDKTP